MTFVTTVSGGDAVDICHLQIINSSDLILLVNARE
jgi:hypothetical protein